MAPPPTDATDDAPAGAASSTTFAAFWPALRVADVQRPLLRNIVALRSPADLFDDLSDDPADTRIAGDVEAQVQPPLYASLTPVIHRPFEEAHWGQAIAWPFRNWQRSRYSDGRFGVWYGADALETTVRESAFHWVHGLLHDAGFDRLEVSCERRVYAVHCAAALLDARAAVGAAPGLLHPADYTLPQALGARLHHEGHPGLVAPSVRHPGGTVYAVMNAAVLSQPKPEGVLTYRLRDGRLEVDKSPGRRWLALDLATL